MVTWTVSQFLGKEVDPLNMVVLRSPCLHVANMNYTVGPFEVVKIGLFDDISEAGVIMGEDPV